jgi:propanol-preferring alcohol dehydrogenase
MRAMLLERLGDVTETSPPLRLVDWPVPAPLEKEIKSVANVTRRDVAEFLELAATLQLRPEIQEYALEEANQALIDLKQKRIHGAKVLRI